MGWRDIIKDTVGDLLDGDGDKKPPKEPPPRPGRDIEILVAPRNSEAHKAATARANDSTVFAERKLFRALNRAAEHLNSQGRCTVHLKIAGGEYTGKAKTGTWLVPPNRSIRLHLQDSSAATVTTGAPVSLSASRVG